MSAEQHEQMRPQVEAKVGAKSYALLYAAGPQWVAGRPASQVPGGAR
jgi:hypothetical protein